MNEDCLKLTCYLGERDRAGGGFMADALTEIYARHELQVSLLLRGVEGFGLRHHLRTDRLLSLSEDLPLVSLAVDARARIQACLPELAALAPRGLVTLERARMLTGGIEGPPQLPWGNGAQTKLTVYLGRAERARGEHAGPRLAFQAVTALLQAHGVDGATVLLGVDGTVHGTRRRARFLADNAAVPVMVIAVGETGRLAGLLPELGSLLERPLVTLERVQVCKRDGVVLEPPRELAPSDPSGLGIWQKLMVLTGEQDHLDGEPLHQRLIGELRRRGAAGATVLRGVWGFRGEEVPHGDSLWQLRRRVPMLTVIVDSPERIRRWFEAVDELTPRTGVVTCEVVPASRSTAGGASRGGLRLASPD